MNCFRILFSGATLFAVSTGSLWGQVPVVQPSEVVLRTPTASNVPIVSSSQVMTKPMGNVAILKTESEETPSPSALQPMLPTASPVLPVIVRPQVNGDSPLTGFVPQVKAEHPDISLPTEIPIVKQAMAGKTLPVAGETAGNGSPVESKPVVPIVKQSMPGKLQPSSTQTGGNGSPGESKHAIPIVAIPKEQVPVVRVGTNPASAPEPLAPTVPIRTNLGIVEAAAATKSQEPVSRRGDRPEIALPTIKPGEEFPRTLQQQTSGSIPVRQAASAMGSEMTFEPVPVRGNGTEEQEATTKQVYIQPAAPLLEQDFARDARGQLAEPADLNRHSHVEAETQQESELTVSGSQSGEVIVGENYLNSDSHDCEHCSGAGCSHCGLGGWNSLGNRAHLNLRGGCENGCFGLMPCAQNYFIGDVLYWTRNGGNVVGTDFGGVGDYDWNFGTQITMGTRVDPLYGHELSYFGLFELDAAQTDLSPAGDIDANFTPGGGLVFADASAFFDAVETTQTVNSQLHSFQVNRVRLGWDVVQSHLGLRYIWFEDEYSLQSRNLGGDTGLLSLDARNQLIGPEVGIKLFYDVGRRISFSSQWKLGGYLNAYHSSTLLQNNGLTQVSNSDSGTGFSASFDLGANAHIHLTQRMRLRGGYGLLWLWDVASVTGNFPSSLTPASGTDTNDSESVLFHGANVGFEYYW